MKHAFLSAIAAATMVAACSSTPSPPTSVTASGAEGNEAQVASVWRSKCGSCHVPVEPGSRKRVEIESALQRHRKRFRLIDDQWT